MLELVDPVGIPRRESQAQRRNLDTPIGRRVGFIWNQYPTTRNFWTRFERALEALCTPPHVARAYKPNTWSPLASETFKKISGEVDYFVVGVGA
ncbi:MAG: hypothetical protein HY322_09070 [Betaproteobacteria bacterium]|nr:hypothetical protein [Betaproteobacteria bacterium]